ncbi:hypothetical protein [Saccharothrix sp. HUAS TT1]|uniref:hypothetical protein n=1 Tax=unclassified Saccharothrix TaxID=2593673 RepID=UPI00345B8FE8
MRVTTLRFDEQQRPGQLDLLFTLDEAASIAEQAARTPADAPHHQPMSRFAQALAEGLRAIRECPHNQPAADESDDDRDDEHHHDGVDHDHVPIILGLHVAALVCDHAATTRPGDPDHEVLAPLRLCLDQAVFGPYYGTHTRYLRDRSARSGDPS